MIYLTKSVLLTLCLLFSVSGFSQVPLPRVDWFNESKGLSLNDDIADVKIDSDGIVWIVTFSEIYRYDGSSFSEINTSHVEHGSFLRFNETPTHKKFVIGIDEGIYFIENDSIRPYRYNSILNKGSVANKFTNKLFDEEDNLIASVFGKGVLKIVEGKTSMRSFKPGSINLIIQDNNLPLFQDGSRKRIHDESKFINEHVYLYDDNYELLDSALLNGVRYPDYRSLTRKNDSIFLISTRTSSIYEFTKQRFIRENKFKHTILNLFVDSKGNLWVSTRGKGVFFFKDGNIDLDDAVIYFPNTKAIVSSEDSEGGIWGYLEKGGVFRINNLFQVYYHEKSGFEDIQGVEVIEKVENILYFSKTRNRLGKLDLSTNLLVNITLPQPILKPFNRNDTLFPIFDMEFDTRSKRLWLTQTGQIRFFEGSEWRNLDLSKFETPLRDKNFMMDYEKHDTKLTAGVHDKQFFICENNEISYISPMLEKVVIDILIQGDSVFLRAKDELYLYYKDSLNSLNNRYPTLDRKIKDWVLWNNELWLSTQKSGLFIAKKDSLKKVKIADLAIKDARLLIQNDSTLWAFSNQGSFQIELREGQSHITSYKALSKNKLTDIEISGNTVYSGTKRSGIMSFSLNDLKKYPLTPPELYFDKIKLGDSNIIENNTTFKVNYLQNSLNVSYHGISYGDWSVNYRYRLMGFQNNWITTVEKEIKYANLPSGFYEFEVQARKGEQLWSSVKKIAFIVSPPIWKTTWFILLVVFATAMLLFWGVRNKIKRENREKMLLISRLTAEQSALRAKMDPHFMFNVISSLQFLVTNHMNEKASQFLEQFSSLMRSTLDQTNLEFVSVNDEKLFLKEYIEMERLRLEERFDFEITISPEVDQESLIPNFLIQPFIENAIHHGLKIKEGKGYLRVHFSQEEKFIEVTVEDNGVGYNEMMNAKIKDSLGRRSHGIDTVKKRLELRNGKESVKIQDISKSNKNRTGTKVTILIKIEKNEGVNN